MALYLETCMLFVFFELPVKKNSDIIIIIIILARNTAPCN